MRSGAGGGRSSDRHADIAAERDVAARLRQDMGDQRRRGRFAVGAGDRDERRGRRARRALAREELDVADRLRRRPPARARRSSAAWDGSAARRATARAPESPTSRPRRDRPAGACCRPCARRASPSSQAATCAPPAMSARSGRRAPNRRGRTTRRAFPRNVATGVMLTSASGWRGRPSPARRR